MRIKTCPKCGNTFVTPEYKSFMVKEWLKYECVCGYSWNEDTKDKLKAYKA